MDMEQGKQPITDLSYQKVAATIVLCTSEQEISVGQEQTKLLHRLEQTQPCWDSSSSSTLIETNSCNSTGVCMSRTNRLKQ